MKLNCRADWQPRNIFSWERERKKASSRSFSVVHSLSITRIGLICAKMQQKQCKLVIKLDNNQNAIYLPGQTVSGVEVVKVSQRVEWSNDSRWTFFLQALWSWSFRPKWTCEVRALPKSVYADVFPLATECLRFGSIIVNDFFSRLRSRFAATHQRYLELSDGCGENEVLGRAAVLPLRSRPLRQEAWNGDGGGWRRMDLPVWLWASE